MSWLSKFTGESWIALGTFVIGSLALTDWWKPLMTAEHAVMVSGGTLWAVGIIHYVQKLAGKVVP